LAGAGLGDQPPLAEPLRQQRLADGVVGLVRAAVQQVLALEPDVEARPRAEPLSAAQRRRPTAPARELLLEFGLERRRRHDAPVRVGELVERRPQELARVAAAEAAERAEPRLQFVCAGGHRAASAAAQAANSARRRPWSFLPGADSTPEQTSMPNGR